MASSSGNNTKLLLVAISYLLFGLFMMAYSTSHPNVAKSGFAVLAWVFAPVQKMTKSVSTTIQELSDRYVFLMSVSDENKNLIERVDALQAHNARLLEARTENERLKNLLQMKDTFNLSGLAANVIGYDPNHWTREIMLNRGSADGIAIGQAVVAAGGVVGQISAVAQNASKVLLLTDLTSGIDAVIQDTRSRGIIEGNGRLGARWKFVLAEEVVKYGDVVVTSGLDGVFPAGLPVGVVTYVADESDGLLFKDVTIRPTADFTRLEAVLVLTKQSIDTLALVEAP